MIIKKTLPEVVGADLAAKGLVTLSSDLMEPKTFGLGLSDGAPKLNPPSLVLVLLPKSPGFGLSS